jgi:hypothetical protein
MDIAGIREEAAFRTKNPDKGKNGSIALSTKNILHYKRSCRFLY